MIVHLVDITGAVSVSDTGVGYRLDFSNGTTRNATPAEILTATKADRIEADRQECRRRLTEFYGDALEQVSRANGLYGATARDNMLAGIESAIDASNAARDAINAAATIQAVEAVTVSWPVLT